MHATRSVAPALVASESAHAASPSGRPWALVPSGTKE